MIDKKKKILSVINEAVGSSKYVIGTTSKKDEQAGTSLFRKRIKVNPLRFLLM